jgi:type I restriction-modification system DNA methylase subunit
MNKIEKLYKACVKYRSILPEEEFQKYTILLLTIQYFEAIYKEEYSDIFSSLLRTRSFGRLIDLGLQKICTKWDKLTLQKTYAEQETEGTKELISNLSDVFNTVNLETKKEFIKAFDYFLMKFSAKNRKRGHYVITPNEIAVLFSRLLKPQKNEAVYDATCGTGTLLVQFANEIKNKNLTLYGQEFDLDNYNLCLLNLYFHGYSDFDIRQGKYTK